MFMHGGVTVIVSREIKYEQITCANEDQLKLTPPPYA